MPRYKLTIAYDGTDFCGWQKQEPLLALPDETTPGNRAPTSDRIVGTVHHDGELQPRLQLRTVQHVVERAIRQVVREPVNLKGSSRTDAGVHARGQVGAFTCSGQDEGDTGRLPTGSADRSLGTTPRRGGWPLSRGTDRLLRALNGKLPDDCLVTAVESVDESFDPTRDTIAKAYSYVLHCGRERPLWDRRFVHQVWDQLDVAAMDAAAKLLIGEHDFAAFAATGHGRLTTVRTILSCSVAAQSGDRVRIEVSGNGFLWNMVRIIAGTLLEVGRGRKKPDDIPRILATKSRRSAGPTLPPTGLCLDWIKFPESLLPPR